MQWSRWVILDIECVGDADAFKKYLPAYANSSELTLISFITGEIKPNQTLIEAITSIDPQIKTLDFISTPEKSFSSAIENELKVYLADSKTLKIAHFALFDRIVLSNFYEVTLTSWLCTCSFSFYCKFPASLKAQATLLWDAGAIKSLATEAKTFMDQKKLNKLREKSTVFKFDAQWLQFVIYNKSDTVALFSLFNSWAKSPVMIDALDRYLTTQQSLYEMDAQINARGVPVDYQWIKTLLSAETKLRKQIKETYEIKYPGIKLTSNKDFPELLSMLLNEPKLKSVAKDVLKTYRDKSPEVQELIEARLISSKISLTKLKSFQEYGESQSIKNTFIFLGASESGRWAGKYCHFLNVPRATLSKDVLIDCQRALTERNESLLSLTKRLDIALSDFLPKLIRSCVSAPSGHQLIISDLKTIEPILHFYLIGDQKILGECLEGDPYKLLASMLYQIPKEEVTKKQRNACKPTFLGCGYGMSAALLQNVMKNVGLQLTLEEAKAHQLAYHTLFPTVRNFYNQLEKMILAAMHTEKPVNYRGLLQFEKKEINLGAIKCVLSIRLPSGREIWYRNLQVITCPDSYSGYRISYMNSFNYYTELWGSRLTGHLIQSLARDVFCESLMALHKANFNIVMHVYDSVICCEKKAGIEERKKQFDSLFGIIPSWLPDFPRAAFKHDSYINKFFI